MDILIHFNEQAFKNDVQANTRAVPYLQNLVEVYNALGLEKLKPKEFSRLLLNTEELIFDKLTGGKEVSIAGIKVHKKKALEILQKPDGYEALLIAVNEVLETFKSGVPGSAIVLNSSSISHRFDVDENANIILKQSYIDELERGHKRYAKSDKAKKLYEFANAIIKTCEDHGVMEMINHNPNGIVGAIRDILEGGGGKPLTIRTQGILNLN